MLRNERVPGLADAPANTYALRMQTAGTPLQFFDGWIYYVTLPMPAEIHPDVIGRYCLVELESGTKLVRWVQRGYKSGTWNLSAPTSPSLANVTLTAATPVLGIRTA